ncbi:nuclease-related domain-containing protein [Pseudarthrobacter siccitolerans]|uniref:nuclease-related domain-containing protein n=1 Tax=Pseudarthrobacter siccitolerans TaxID=861266 RepID=UPI0027B8CD6D|nr:nuclease-related domain-containing protein [Pseudarthrobacter siccitolerans]
MLEALESQGWMALHDVHWPGRPKANLDHILVGPGGVIVIDAKNWSGDLQLRNGILRQNGYSREREVTGVLEQGAAVAALLEPQHRRYVQAWLCMVGQPNLQGTTASGARVQGIETLPQAVAATAAVLDPGTVGAVHRYLTNQLAGGSSPSVLTTGHVPTGPPDFAHSSGPAATLQRWRTARDPADDPRTLRPSGTSRPKPEGTKKPGCFGILFRLALIIFVLGVILNALSQLSPQPQRVPVPSPEIVSTLPGPP